MSSTATAAPDGSSDRVRCPFRPPDIFDSSLRRNVSDAMTRTQYCVVPILQRVQQAEHYLHDQLHSIGVSVDDIDPVLSCHEIRALKHDRVSLR